MATARFGVEEYRGELIVLISLVMASVPYERLFPAG